MRKPERTYVQVWKKSDSLLITNRCTYYLAGKTKIRLTMTAAFRRFGIKIIEMNKSVCSQRTHDVYERDGSDVMSLALNSSPIKETI